MTHGSSGPVSEVEKMNKRFEINMDFDTFIMNKRPMLRITDDSTSKVYSSLKMIEFEWLWFNVVIRLWEDYDRGWASVAMLEELEALEGTNQALDDELVRLLTK